MISGSLNAGFVGSPYEPAVDSALMDHSFVMVLFQIVRGRAPAVSVAAASSWSVPPSLPARLCELRRHASLRAAPGLCAASSFRRRATAMLQSAARADLYA